jgi:adenylyltransferase/sulfurtransferase
MARGLREASVLVVGVGGLGCPAARILAQSGVGRITLCDDDVVDESNLHRQTLFGQGDLGQDKAELAASRLRDAAKTAGHSCEVEALTRRVVPDDARELVTAYDLVLEGADNFATKFLVADACALSGVPVVQAGAVRWVGWTLCSMPQRSACLRCVFEGVPEQRDTCATAGVVGPVVGVIAALEAALALRALLGDETAFGSLVNYEALTGRIRTRTVRKRPGCELCDGAIVDTDLSRYLGRTDACQASG